VGVRGPFGTAWPLEQAQGKDVVIVAGGIGLAPLRPALYHLLHHRYCSTGLARRVTCFTVGNWSAGAAGLTWKSSSP